MTLSIDRYVSATSGVIGAPTVAERERIPLRFTTDPRLPAGTVATVDKYGTATLFPGSNPENDYAAQLFGYTSPAPIRQVARMRWAPYVDVARPARIYGGAISSTLDDFKLITAGLFGLTLGDQTKAIGPLNLTTVVTFADVASAVQTSIRSQASGDAKWATATVSYDAVAKAFNLVAGDGGSAAIEVTPNGPDNTLTLLGWSAGALPVMSPGADPQSPLEALRAAEQVTDSFGTFVFPAAYGLTLEEIREVSLYNKGLNVKYAFLVPVTLDNYADYSQALINIGGTALILNRLPGEYKESLDAAITAAIDYNATNSVTNYMYRRLGAFAEPNDVTSDAQADALIKARVNFYGTTATAGQKLSFYQEGFMCGLPSDPLDRNVYTNEQWFKSAVQADLLNLELDIGSLSIDTGPSQILAVVANRVQQAKRNGTIRVGKLLTTLQKIDISNVSGDFDAWRDVQTNGYWADCVIVERVEDGVTKYTAQYTIAYAKNDVIRKIVGSHNLV